MARLITKEVSPSPRPRRSVPSATVARIKKEAHSSRYCPPPSRSGGQSPGGQSSPEIEIKIKYEEPDQKHLANWSEDAWQRRQVDPNAIHPDAPGGPISGRSEKLISRLAMTYLLGVHPQLPHCKVNPKVFDNDPSWTEKHRKSFGL